MRRAAFRRRVAAGGRRTRPVRIPLAPDPRQCTGSRGGRKLRGVEQPREPGAIVIDFVVIAKD